MTLSNAKSAVTKLEVLQEKVKKSLRSVDVKDSVTLHEEAAEYVHLKSLRAELDNM